MRNKDLPVIAHEEIIDKVTKAAQSGDATEFSNGLSDLFQTFHDEIIGEASENMQGLIGSDSPKESTHSIRRLTGEEINFYNDLIDAIKVRGASGNNPLMSLTDADKTFPITVIDRAMEDMRASHPLLDAIDTIAVTGSAKFLFNTDAGDNASWGAFGSEITKEITSGFLAIDLGQFKLSAWLPISQDMVELGPTWLDSYIRTCLSEALAIGFEYGVVTGTGNNMPIGMDRQVGAGVVVTGGVYPRKNAIVVTDFGRATYGSLVARLAKTAYGKPRDVRDLILVCNPADYYSIVQPATTIMTPDGRFVNDVLPIPTKIIRSVAVAQGEAILGMGKRYLLGIGGRRGVQFSDDYKFLEDQRYYKVVAYANGRPKDNNAFLLLDISGLEPAYYEVKAAESF